MLVSYQTILVFSVLFAWKCFIGLLILITQIAVYELHNSEDFSYFLRWSNWTFSCQLLLLVCMISISILFSTLFKSLDVLKYTPNVIPFLISIYLIQLCDLFVPCYWIIVYFSFANSSKYFIFYLLFYKPSFFLNKVYIPFYIYVFHFI